MHPAAQNLGKPFLPTYESVAAFLERKNGAGARLAMWTIARTLLIAPPMMLVGVKPKQAFLGALLASGLISALTLLRIYNASCELGVAGPRGRGVGALGRGTGRSRPPQLRGR